MGARNPSARARAPSRPLRGIGARADGIEETKRAASDRGEGAAGVPGRRLRFTRRDARAGRMTA